MNANEHNAKRTTHEYSSFFYPCAETSKLNMYIPCSIIHEPQRKACYTWIFLVLLSMCRNKQVKHVYTLFYYPWAETSICIFLVLRNTIFSNALKNNILQLFCLINIINFTTTNLCNFLALFTSSNLTSTTIYNRNRCKNNNEAHRGTINASKLCWKLSITL